eukprot:g4839.t1
MYILNTKPELLQDTSTVSNIADFDVFLADYFKVITGSASGGWIASYLASKGRDGTLRSVLLDQEVIEKYGHITPGTSRALLVFFNQYAGVIYPQVVSTAEAPASETQENSEVVPGVNAPRYDNAGLVSAMDVLFGDGTLTDLTTTCLIPMLDLETGTVVTMLSDHFDDSVRFGFTDFMFSNAPPSLVDPFVPDVMFRGGIDFKLTDIAVAVGSSPILFPAINVTSVSGPETEFLGFDGFLGVAGNPTFLALAYAANRTQTTALDTFAVLSIGTGAEIGFYEDNANGGVVQWLAGDQELLQIVLFLAGSDFSSQLDLLFYANPRVQFGQYLRIQTFGDTGTPEGELFSQEDNPASVPGLQRLGEELATNYTESITSFVSDFIFA